MYPDYRKTAEHRLEAVVKGVLVTAALLFAGGTIFMVATIIHFTAKFW